LFEACEAMFQIRRLYFLNRLTTERLPTSSQSYHTSSERLCHQGLVEQLKHI